MVQERSHTRAYIWSAIALLALLALTVGVSKVQLGPAGLVVSLSIASAKALIVAIFFMHLKGAHAVTKLFAGASLFWLVILIGLSLSDVLTRT